MRTTLTIEDDLVPALKKAARASSFKAAVNDAIRRGLNSSNAKARQKIELPVFHTGFREPFAQMNFNHLAAALEDDAIVAKMALGR
jgi:hypothetical protein